MHGASGNSPVAPWTTCLRCYVFSHAVHGCLQEEKQLPPSQTYNIIMFSLHILLTLACGAALTIYFSSQALKDEGK